MKRRDAFRKARTICQRLDDMDEAQAIEFRARPLELYIFGSALTDKAKPADLDLVIVYDELTELLTPAELHGILSYGKPSPFRKLRTHLCRGMKMIRLSDAVDTLAWWPNLRLFPEARGLYLIWKPGLDWAPLLDHLEANPVPWAGPRPEEDLDAAQAAWEARPEEEREQQIAQILAALAAREKELSCQGDG
jgi:hypothetical protein